MRRVKASIFVTWNPGSVSSARHGIHSCPTPTPSRWSETFPRTSTRYADELGMLEDSTVRLHASKLPMRAASRKEPEDLHSPRESPRPKELRKKRYFDASRFPMCLRTLDSSGVGEPTRRT